MGEGQRRWQRISSSRGSVNAWFRYRHDEIRLPDGSLTTYAYKDDPAAVIIVPVTAGGQLALVRQYRYPVDDWCYELPAGGVGDETPEEAARRELLEEAGGRCQTLEPAGTFYGLPGACNVRYFVFLATGVELGQNHPEATEDLEVLCLEPAAVLEMIQDGTLNDGPTLAALCRCLPLVSAWISPKKGLPE